MNENTVKQGEILPFQLIGGGKPGGPNWLAELPKGTVFCCRKINDSLERLTTHVVTFQKTKVTCLGYCLGEESTWFYVDSARFSKMYTLVEIIGNVEPKEQEKEEVQNGGSDRSS